MREVTNLLATGVTVRMRMDQSTTAPQGVRRTPMQLIAPYGPHRHIHKFDQWQADTPLSFTGVPTIIERRVANAFATS